MMELFSDDAWLCLSGGVLYRVFWNIMLIREFCLHAAGCHFALFMWFKARIIHVVLSDDCNCFHVYVSCWKRGPLLCWVWPLCLIFFPEGGGRIFLQMLVPTCDNAWCVFICGLFNKSGRLYGIEWWYDWWSGKDVEGSGLWPNWCTVREYAWNDWVNVWKTLVVLTFRGPCIVICSYNKTNEMH